MKRDLMDILACPKCRSGLEQAQEKLICTRCGRRYPIKDGIPIMLVDEAETPQDNAKES